MGASNISHILPFLKEVPASRVLEVVRKISPPNSSITLYFFLKGLDLIKMTLAPNLP